MKKLRFHIEAIIGDRHDSPDSLAEDEIHNWISNMQKQDILKIETDEEYWEDIPQELFELIKTKIKDRAYQHTMAKGHLWLEIEISFDEKSENNSTD